MRFRWTIKELRELPPSRIIRGILNERISDLNVYAPLSRKLRGLEAKIDKNAAEIDAILGGADVPPRI